MADNITVTPGSGSTVAAENITVSGSATLLQRIKLALGTYDVDGGDVSTTNPMPVTGSTTVLSMPAITGSVSVINSVLITGSTTIASMPSVTGSVAIVNTPTVTGSVSVLNSVLITGSTTIASMPSITGSVTILGTVTITGSTSILSIPSITGSVSLVVSPSFSVANSIATTAGTGILIPSTASNSIYLTSLLVSNGNTAGTIYLGYSTAGGTAPTTTAILIQTLYFAANGGCVYPIPQQTPIKLPASTNFVFTVASTGTISMIATYYVAA